MLIHLSATRMNPLNVVFWNAVCANCIFVVAVCIERPRTTGSIKEILILISSGFFGGCGSITFSIAVMITREPGDAVALYFTLPISVIILEVFFHQGKVKMAYVIFAFLSFAGVIFVVKPSFLFHNRTNDNATNTLGAVLSLSSSFLMVAQFIAVSKLKIFATNFSLVVFLTNSFVLSISFMLCVYLRVFKVPDSVEKVMFILFTGCLYVSLYSLVYLAVTNERPVVVSVIMTSEVAFTFIAQSVALSLTTTWNSVVGGILISLSCLGVSLAKQADEENPENEDLLQEN
ncbi:hypothetical protein HOLleu_10771 [Holothuria leucospilota]|uniref:EamA domain-containing protein n=1 Tax=Holothuria leucospilota TaxID=206669 RepID=A0A9Q1CF61_HOLLE|nr:hypothetical protein HOLleu_10771 [Holothuria leucospilota]